MGEKKYQVFISSTYDDLKDERKAVEEVVIRAGDIPVGMEAFPAADDEQFEFIKSIIDSCDYYLLLIAGRYGSVASDGLSYTEKEYDYAAAKGLPVLVMLRSELEQLTVSKSEKTERGKRALIAFIQKVSEKRLRKEWTSLDGLKLGVREALDHAKATKPRPGWVRGDKTASIDVLEELNELRKERAAAEKNAGPRISLEESELAGLETIISMSGTQKVRQQGYTNGRRVKWGAKKPLGDVFSFVAPDLRGDLIHNALNN